VGEEPLDAGVALGGLDPVKEGLPNVGPDWGLCVLPFAQGQKFPQAMMALAVKSAPAESPTDRALFNAIQFFTNLALLQHNAKHDAAKQIRMRAMQQGKAEIKYLVNDQLFPPGFQPALALKEGYLVLATSPDALKSLEDHGAGPLLPQDETLFFRFSPVELARLLRAHREKIIEHVAANQGVAKAKAGQTFDSLAQALDLFDGLTLSHRAGDDQLAWILRIQPVR